MSSNVNISERDRALFRLLEMTPASAPQIRKASVTFPGNDFRDDRRVRERLQVLTASGFIKSFPSAVAGGGLSQYYRLAPLGYRMIHSETNASIPKTLFAEVAPSRLRHSTITGDVIIHTLVSCHNARVRVLSFHGDGRLVLEAGEYRQVPDCHFQLEQGGKAFNILFEIDNATEPLDSLREQSIRTKILGYEVYQDWVLRNWRESGRKGYRPSFRVAFLTLSTERANHMLWLAQTLGRNKDRRLVYTTTQDAYLGCTSALALPIFNDHHGNWQSLVDSQPTATYLHRAPIRLTAPVAPFPIL